MLERHRFRVWGDFPLLLHNPAQMRRNEGVKQKKIPTPEEEAAAGLYLVEGGFGIPSVAFRSALLNGLKNKKVGKASAISVFQAAVFNVDEFCLLIDGEGNPLLKYGIDTRRAVVQRQGILRSRPRFEKGWGCILELEIDVDMVSPEQVVEHLNVAGLVVGVGDFRIEKRGPFGRFHVELMK